MAEFVCRKCGACCCQPGFVYLTEQESVEIAEYCGENIYHFNSTFCDILDRRKLVLKKKTDEVCVFLTDSKCNIYPVRPRQCREFPVEWKTEKSAVYCEGQKQTESFQGMIDIEKKIV